MKKMPDRVWVEIHLDHIEHNYQEIKKHVGDKVLCNMVIKADAYGHGAVEIARLLYQNQADMLSVASLDEALQLRKKNIKTPLLILGNVLSERVTEAIHNQCMVTVFDLDMAKEFSQKAIAENQKIKAHVKLDTGMNRVGFHYTKPEDIKQVFCLEGLDIQGIFTHFSMADNSDTSYTDTQYQRFLDCLSDLNKRNINIPVKHVCNSGGVILHPDKHMDMIRPGLLLYGLYPSQHTKTESSLHLKSAMSFRSRIIEVKEVDAGQPVSYENNFVTKRKTKIATIACGYADGYPRALSSKAKVIIHDQAFPIIGNICMDMCMVDVTDAKQPIARNDWVELFDGIITVDDIAKICNTINYELICKIGMRVPRVYYKNGKIFKISNYIA